jgi:hypothetical protein
MTVTAEDLLVIRRVRLADRDLACALVPGHFVLEGQAVGLAAPAADPGADPIGWACAVCTHRLQIRSQPKADLIVAPYRAGDLFVWFVATARFPGACRRDPGHRRRKGMKSGLVFRLAGDPPDLSARDAHAQLGWCCAECLMELISR